jgi:DNA-binding LytR/AlgR family response regulator
MDIVSDIAKAAESVVVSAAEGTATSAVESLATGAAKTAIGAVIPTPSSILSLLKIVGVVVGIALLGYIGLRAWSAINQAAADHAAVSTLTTQRDAALNAAKYEVAVADAVKARNEAQAAQILAFQKADATRTAATDQRVQDIQNAQPTTGCKPSPALLRGLLGKPVTTPGAHH